MDDTNRGIDRRSFLKWAAAVGLTSVAPQTVAAVAQGEGNGPPDDLPVDPPATNRDGDVQISHPLEYERVRDRVTTATETDDPTVKYDDRLERELEDGDRDEYGLHVRTVGQPTTVETERRGRQIDGWSPTEGEVRRLSQFGRVGRVPDFLSTKISLYEVDAADVSTIATLPFVLSVEYKPVSSVDPLTGDGGAVPLDGHDDWSSEAFDPDTVRDDPLGFEAVSNTDAIDPNSDVKIGVIDDGYWFDAPKVWDENYASAYIDEALADAFEDWLDPEPDNYNWRTTDADHGTIVTNTLAYMLGDLAEDMLVPLPALMSSQRTGLEDEEREDAVRSAISFATYHDIDVLNISYGFEGAEIDYCQSKFCDELEGYASAGNIAVAAAGNNPSYVGEREADEPASSRFTIAVGGVHDESCGDGYWRTQYSAYSDPATYDGTCDPCHNLGDDEQFVPDVYGVYEIQAQGTRNVGGTSNAAPQFAAAAALLKEHGVDDFWEVEQIARTQSQTDVCPSDQSKAGQVLHANDMLGDVAPYPVEDVTVEWVTTHAAKVSWDPPHSPGPTDVAEYTIERAGDDSNRTWTTDGPTSEIVLDGLGPTIYTAFSFRLYATDERDNTSEGTFFGFQILPPDGLIADIETANTEPAVGETAQFWASDETEDGTQIESLEWHFDDGDATDTGWYVSHTYDEPGTYWVTLVATTDEGEQRLAAREITVS